MERSGLNDMAITTTPNNLASHSALDKRTNQNDKVEPVTVSVIEPKLLPAAKTTNYIELLLTFILCSIGALTFMSYTLSLSFDPPQVENHRKP